MIRTEAIETAPADSPRVSRERINETRYVKTFTCEEVLKLLTVAVLEEPEAYADRYANGRENTRAMVLSPGLPEQLTVKVTVQQP